MSSGIPDSIVSVSREKPPSFPVLCRLVQVVDPSNRADQSVTSFQFEILPAAVICHPQVLRYSNRLHTIGPNSTIDDRPWDERFDQGSSDVKAYFEWRLWFCILGTRCIAAAPA